MEAKVAQTANGNERISTVMDDGGPECTTSDLVSCAQGVFQSLLGEVPDDFDSWTSLIAQTEKSYANDVQRICLVYDGFLSEFPLCNGYWKKYAAHKGRLCVLNEVEEIYRRSVQAVPYSVDLWVSYCSFGVMTYKDFGDVQRLFEQGLSCVRKDYFCHLLWDKYAEYAYSQKQWSQLAHIYLRTLQFPTKKLRTYYDWFKRLLGMWAKDMGYQHEGDIQTQVMDNFDDSEQRNSKGYQYEEILKLIEQMFDRNDNLAQSAAIKKYSTLGEQLYQISYQLDTQISHFEGHITKRHFDMEMLDDGQLQNWHQYLNFVEMQGDFEWAIKLYERCLIPCASYSEFWVRYVEFTDVKGGKELANHALERASTVFLKKVPAFHLYCAMFKEQLGDVSSARSILLHWGPDFASDFLANINKLANLEKRMGNIPAAYMIYERAIEVANEKQSLQIIPILYKHFAHFVFVESGKIDAAMDVLIRGIQQLPCKSTLKNLVEFLTMHDGASQIPKLGSFIANALNSASNISRHLSTEDRECISRAFLEFVDLYGNFDEIRRAWNSHWKLFPYRMKSKSNEKDKTKQACNGTVEALPNNSDLYNSSDIPAESQTEHPAELGDDSIVLRDITHISHQEVKYPDSNMLEVTISVGKVLEQLPLDRQLHVMGNKEDSECLNKSQLNKSLSVDFIAKSHAIDENETCEGIRSSSPNLDSHQSNQTIISNSSPQEAVSIPVSDRDENEKSTFDSGTDKLDLFATKSSTNLQNDTREDKDPCSQVTPASEVEEKPTSIDVQLQENPQHDLPSSSFSQNPIHLIDSEQTLKVELTSQNLNSRLDNMVQESNSQQSQVNALLPCTSTGISLHSAIDQGSSCPSQVWTAPQGLRANQSQIIDQMADAQGYQNTSIACATQNLQQQGYAFTLSQPGSQSVSQVQADVYQQLMSSNVQYSAQSTQGFAPHYWHYYQQQLYYLQQLQQHQQQHQSRQMYSVVEHQPSNRLLQQVQDNNQEQLLASQLVPLQQPHQQQGMEELNQQEQKNLSNSDQILSQQQHQVEQTAQPEQQNEQVLNIQQQQQLLYLQQQQQLYMQQQQLYLQQQVQQQLLMHQYQQRHQTHQQLFQQQQTPQQHPHQWQQQQPTLLQQQPALLQQQPALLQQQQQHQQYQMQLLQQQQHQQFQMLQQQQRQSSASGSDILSSNTHFQAEVSELHDTEQPVTSHSPTLLQTSTL